MDFKDALAKARESRPEPVLVAVAVADDLFNVEVRRLDGMDWVGVMAECPPSTEKGARLGYEAERAALVACRQYSQLLTTDGDVVTGIDWDDLFKLISGTEIGAIAATWWALNMADPNRRVVELKKALAGGGKTSSS